MDDVAVVAEPAGERPCAAQSKSWIEALGIIEEIRSIYYPLTRILVDVPATVLGLASLYGLADVLQNGHAYTPFRSGGPGPVTASEDLFLYLLSIAAMSLSVAASLFVFFRDEP